MNQAKTKGGKMLRYAKCMPIEVSLSLRLLPFLPCKLTSSWSMSLMVERLQL